MAVLELTRAQILAYRRRVGGLTERMPAGARSLRRAAWAGLQDSVPCSALLSIHARVEGTTPATWEDRSLVQLWGPRHAVYVVAARDVAVFSLGLLPEDTRRRTRATDLADQLRRVVGATPTPYSQAGKELGVDPNQLRYAATTGTVLMRWEGAGKPTIWTVPPPAVDPREAQLELARRYLNVSGPATPASFARWAGVSADRGEATFAALTSALTEVGTPTGPAWILEDDELALRADPGPEAPARLLPSGDLYYLAWEADRQLIVPDPDHRARLWTSRVWPGALLVHGEIVGTWRRSGTTVTVSPWQPLSAIDRDAVEAEAATLPLLDGEITVEWEAE